MENARSLKSISDDELLRRLADLLRQSRRVEAELVAHIGEVDQRGLYAREAQPSMFAYCTEVLRLSEAEAYLRIAAARAARAHPVLLGMLGDGRLHLTAIAKLAPHLTPENRDRLLQQATHRSKRQIEELVAALAPRADVTAMIRKLPERRPSAEASRERGSYAWPIAPSAMDPSPNGADAGGQTPEAAGSRSSCSSISSSEPVAAAAPQLRPDAVASRPGPIALVKPLSPDRYKVQFTASAGLRDKLARLQALMRPSVPDGDLAAIIEQAVTEKLARLEARRFAKAAASRKGLEQATGTPATRYIPAAVRRAVAQRDGGRCAFVDGLGRRCPAQDRLEYHHRRPFGFGGDHDPRNIALVCRAHNTYLARHDYGRRIISQYGRPKSGELAKAGACAAVGGEAGVARGQP